MRDDGLHFDSRNLRIRSERALISAMASALHALVRMIYVTEVGPLPLGFFASWVVLIFDDAGGATQVTPHVARTRFSARKWAAADLRARGAKNVRCLPTLEEYGYSRGWKVEAPSPARKLATAAALISLENEIVLGPAAFAPSIPDLLADCAQFQVARPWKNAAVAHQPVVITSGHESRIAAVTGASDAPPGIVLFPDLDLYERAMSRSPDRSSLGDAVVVALMRSQSRTAELVEAATGQRFNLLLRRRRRGRESVFSEEDVTWMRLAMRTLAGQEDLDRPCRKSPEVVHVVR